MKKSFYFLLLVLTSVFATNNINNYEYSLKFLYLKNLNKLFNNEKFKDIINKNCGIILEKYAYNYLFNYVPKHAKNILNYDKKNLSLLYDENNKEAVKFFLNKTKNKFLNKIVYYYNDYVFKKNRNLILNNPNKFLKKSKIIFSNLVLCLEQIIPVLDKNFYVFKNIYLSYKINNLEQIKNIVLSLKNYLLNLKISTKIEKYYFNQILLNIMKFSKNPNKIYYFNIINNLRFFILHSFSLNKIEKNNLITYFSILKQKNIF